MNERVLVVCGHPDDEALGCGGTIAKHSAAGDYVFVMTFTNGVSARGYTITDTDRKNAFESACRILGVGNTWQGHYADNEMDTASLLSYTKDIENVMRDAKPTTVYTHHLHDLNIDHQLVAQATRVACRPQPGCIVQKLLHFEVASSSEWGGRFAPNYFVVLDADLLAKKLAAFACYADEVREYPHPRSRTGLEDLAHWRGASIGVRAAEAFECERIIVP